MAAIAGAWGQTGTGDPTAHVARILTRMRHRAPHGHATWSGDGIALAHGALHATPDAPREHQPVVRNGAVLLVDGRIDDRAALVRRLGMPAEWQGTDPELFVIAWERWGTDLGHHIVGDFALAVWDVRARCLWLLRDRVGVRPLYWARTDGGMAFASQAEALLGLPGVTTGADRAHVLYVLAPQLGDGPLDASWYRDVRKVPAGHWVRVDAEGRSEQRRWWQPTPGVPLRLDGFGEYCEAFLEVFGEAVACRLRSPSRPGLLLSGGIDSAAVLAVARRSAMGGPTPLVPVSLLREDDGGCQESANIRAMLAREPQAIRVPVPSFGGAVAAREMALAPWTPPHPVDNSVLLPMAAFRAARDAGLTVMLDGIDGDQVMSAPDDYVGRMVLSGHASAAWSEARLASRHHTYLQHRSPGWILARGLLPRIAPRWVGAARMWLHQRSGRLQPLGERLRPDLPGLRDLREAMWQRQWERWSALHGQSPEEQLAWSWVHSGLFRGLESYDHAAARFGLETRHPWCDQRVLDFFLRVPMQVKVGQGWTKYVARAACARWLPEEVAWHSGKHHLGTPVIRASMNGMTPAERDALADDMAEGLGPWVRPDLLRAHVQRLRAGTADYETYDLASLGAWLAWLARGAP